MNTGDQPTDAWSLYSHARPQSAGMYEWRIASKAVPGAVLIVAAHMRMRGAGGSNVLSPSFDHWDGWNVLVPEGIQWRTTHAHADLKQWERKVVEVEGLSPRPCIYCGRSPRIEADQMPAGGGIVVGAAPWNLNSWHFVCCSWGTTPRLEDPREIERIRAAAFAKAAEAQS